MPFFCFGGWSPAAEGCHEQVEKPKSFMQQMFLPKGYPNTAAWLTHRLHICPPMSSSFRCHPTAEMHLRSWSLMAGFGPMGFCRSSSTTPSRSSSTCCSGVASMAWETPRARP